MFRERTRLEYTEESNLRSKEMALCEIYFETGSAYECVAELGELSAVQFKDVNDFGRKYVNEILDCCDMEQKLKFIEKEILKNDIPILEPSYIPDAPNPLDTNDLKVIIEGLETELENAVRSYNNIRHMYLYLEQKRIVILTTNKYFELSDQMRFQPPPAEDEHAPLLEGAENIPMYSCDDSIKFCSVAGVILQAKVPAFEKMLWRVFCRNVFVHVKPLEIPFEDAEYNTPVQKAVFIIFFQGESLKNKIYIICEGFKATIYDSPDNMSERGEMLSTIKTDMQDLQIVLGGTSDFHHRLLLVGAKNLRMWNMKVLKAKSIYCTLNMFRVMSASLIAQCWIPVCKMELVTSALVRGTERSGGSMPPVITRLNTCETPPTYNSVNKYTEVFQALVDSYGFARYGEINPAPFSIVTFPFLFAVMFGDVGHGLLMLFAGICFQMTEERVQWVKMGEVMKLLFHGRYLIILMGLFSVYTGLLYNECFSVPLNVFGSQWTINYTDHSVLDNKFLQLNPETNFSASPYPFGFDPVWKASKNGLSVINSYKMKSSVILGVAHMLFGIFLSFWNFRHYADLEGIRGQFIPRLFFMASIFLYLVFLIFLKWALYGPHKSEKRSSHCSPSILMTLIRMVLLQRLPSREGDECDPYMFPYQYHIQLLLLSVAGICIPWMMFYKPMRMCIKNRAAAAGALSPKQGDGTVLQQHDESGITTQSPEPAVAVTETHAQAEELSYGEMFVHEGVMATEFVLGAVSHTASYLRLWALSLAHSQLSDVLWAMVFRPGIRVAGPLGPVCTAICFAMWAVFTTVILIMIEGLSAFLHTLRLHWYAVCAPT
ncbi:V-type proton ATPase 116 kDa subunit a isoform X3 [Cryptotermes secundus]|uniref:V-type proton ATPase 116 kDa subunit a isoform X3 n=1 Tax=Cryptotermes secundus TaxID=105785 RepID=UPI001454DB95|nr:V-type proton ATPase 116 kDa subunit a isoform X3 [Cryptotermes secundus]